MKCVLFLIASLFSIIAEAQSYRCFQTNAVPYFTSQQYHLKDIRVDSVKTINSDIHYFLYRTPRGSSLFFGTTLDSNGGSWVGKEVIEQPDGATIIPNL